MQIRQGLNTDEALLTSLAYNADASYPDADSDASYFWMLTMLVLIFVSDANLCIPPDFISTSDIKHEIAEQRPSDKKKNCLFHCLTSVKLGE